MHMDTGTQRLIARKEGPIGFLIFNHPERHNAVSLDMWAGIPRVLSAFEADPEVRAVVFAGAGEKAFISGADISQFETARADGSSEQNYSSIAGEATRAMEHLSKPSIAMIRGYCIGGGLAIALTCDLRIASQDSRFAIPAAKLGLGYRFDGVRRLVDVVGPAYASEILFTARRFSAEEALRMQLVNRVVEVAQLEAAVRESAQLMAENAPLTLRAAKLAIKEALKDPERRHLDKVNAAVAACFDSADYKEGRRAFMSKEKPRFQGK
jgi:enoyl-CoA hydratase/carnithine racemase